MGWYTDKSKGWELNNMWGFYLSILSIILFPSFFIGIPAITTIAMGITVKKRSWLFIGAFNIILTTLSAIFYLQRLIEFNFTIGDIAFYIFWPILFLLILPFANAVYNLFLTKTFLQRLDIKSRHSLKWGENYNYNQDYSEKHRPPSKKEIFIYNLKHWKNRIQNKEVKFNIEKMIDLTNAITINKDSIKNEIFLSRHSHTVENVLKQYYELEHSSLQEPYIEESKEQLTDVIDLSTQAFEKELTQQYQMNMLTSSAETQAYIQNLKNKGLLEN